MRKKIIIKKIVCSLLAIFLFSSASADTSFNSLKKKQASYLDFFLLKLENKLVNRTSILASQAYATRVQYSNIGIEVNFESDNDKIFINIYAIMDKNRYSKKKYNQKITDCNTVRNLLFYNRYGYTLFRQKRDPNLSEEEMTEIFKSVFLNNLTLNEKEIKFLLERIFVKVTIFHPVSKVELTCKGKINDYELE